jgi:HPr kinase/phosphorylase
MEMREPILTVKDLICEKGVEFQLELIAGQKGTFRQVKEVGVDFLGLALVGFSNGLSDRQIQVLGEREIQYLSSLSESKQLHALQRVVSVVPPCLIIAQCRDFPPVLTRLGDELDIPVIRTSLPSVSLAQSLVRYLELRLAPEKVIHGTLMDVYGVGLLLVGESGIGKSESALDLIHRGHRLVADDLVLVTRIGPHVLVGTGCERSNALRHYIEIRGIGIIDVYSIYGVRAIRLRKRVEVEVKLVAWSDELNFERVGLEKRQKQILGVPINQVTIPVLPGKYISVLCEVIAMNYLLELQGYHPARMFEEELSRIMAEMVERHISGDGTHE